MAASLNKVLLMGNLTRDPELRYIPSGAAVANFTVAVNRVYKDSAGEKKEEVSFLRVVVWGKMAEVCGEYLAKGRPVLVEGRLRSRNWEGNDGQKKSTVEVMASNVQFLGSKGDQQQKPQTVEKAPEVGSIDLDADANVGSSEEIPF
jgi:single-strand DNA-binding protein